MQVVAKFQAVAPSNSDLVDRIIAQLDQWKSRKFLQHEDGSAVVRHSGVAALEDRVEAELNGAKLNSYEVLEPIVGGHLQTHVQFLVEPDTIHFNCTLSISADGGLAPPEIDLHAPRFVREIYKLDPSWRFSSNSEYIVPRYITVGVGDVETFLNLLHSRQRRLPLVAISEFEGRTIAGDLHERAASDLSGLGHTCRLSRDASWAITNQLGKEWSVYNGAVRLFWPFRANGEHPQNHRLWTFDALTRRGENEIEIRDWLRRQLRERLMEASGFLSDDPAFRIFEKNLERSKWDEARSRGVHKEPALQQEIESLRAALDARDTEIETLRSNVEALTIALRSQTSPADQGSVEAVPPATVEDAIAHGRLLYAGRLAFGDEIDNQAAELNPGAGPPEKVLRYLATLADLSGALEMGPIGKSAPIWLRDANVDASGESETVKKSRAARLQRTFRFGGEGLYCEFHAKPSDGVSPDQCVRIYFTLSDQAPRVRVGYIGRHFD